MSHSLCRFSIILVAVTAACNAPEEERAATQAAPGSSSGDPSVVHHPDPPSRPATKQDSLQMEGMYEPMTVTLAEPASSVPFSTYLPANVELETASADEGEGFYFYTTFGGRRHENSFMLVFLLPSGSTRADAQRIAEAFRTSRAQFDGIVRTDIGEYNGRVFYIGYVYPREFAEGYGPRMAYVKREWIWTNDGQPLQATSLPPRE